MKKIGASFIVSIVLVLVLAGCSHNMKPSPSVTEAEIACAKTGDCGQYGTDDLLGGDASKKTDGNYGHSMIGHKQDSFRKKYSAPGLPT